MIWLLAVLAFLTPWIWRYLVIPATGALGLVLIFIMTLWTGSVFFVFLAMLT